MYDLIIEHWKKYVEKLEKEISKGNTATKNCWKKS